MMNPSIGVAVIGGGMAGRAHAAGYRSASTLFETDRPDVRLVAIADTNEAVADDTAGGMDMNAPSTTGGRSPRRPTSMQ